MVKRYKKLQTSFDLSKGVVQPDLKEQTKMKLLPINFKDPLFWDILIILAILAYIFFLKIAN
jgi:hypothetical protein